MDRSTCTSIFDEVLNHAIEFAKVRIADSASQNTVPELLLSAPQLTHTISRKKICGISVHLLINPCGAK